MGLAENMDLALGQARKARSRGEVPIGAVITLGDQLVAVAGNTRERDDDPLGHAELTALREASKALGRWRLTGCTLYVTLEPCPMCAAALIQARVDKVVFGASDPKLGACGSVWSLPQAPEWNHRVEVLGGVREAECAALITEFFRSKRV